MTEDEPLPGEELRRARRARRMTQGRLAQLLEVDPRTVGRWEAADAVPQSVVPALLHIFGELASDDSAAVHRVPDDPPLRSASHAQLLAELARRIEGAPRPDTGRLPDVPTGRYRFPKSKGPSARANNGREQDEPGSEQSM
ncbi:helix-turn-helix domain-containing protein [Pseudonocardia sediminis]|uniref:helix-turn-helix domain-containing protein n=1 Tax=Pseudonocardia sediminis TaxID=1397368 RepID=UPI0013EF3B87|nr:helix-turn-helix domain-containing protein [Pseudonocardia sediminis]